MNEWQELGDAIERDRLTGREVNLLRNEVHRLRAELAQRDGQRNDLADKLDAARQALAASTASEMRLVKERDKLERRLAADPGQEASSDDGDARDSAERRDERAQWTKDIAAILRGFTMDANPPLLPGVRWVADFLDLPPGTQRDPAYSDESIR